MFTFLTDTTKTDFLHILVRTHLLVLRCQHPCISWSSLTRYIENAAARSWSWFKWGERGGVVIWWKICWHVFLRGHLREILFENLTPFEKFWSDGKEEARPGGGIMNMCRKNSPANRIDCISLVYGNTMYCGAGLHTTVTLMISQLKWLPRLTWGEKCSENSIGTNTVLRNG